MTSIIRVASRFCSRRASTADRMRILVDVTKDPDVRRQVQKIHRLLGDDVGKAVLFAGAVLEDVNLHSAAAAVRRLAVESSRETSERSHVSDVSVAFNWGVEQAAAFAFALVSATKAHIMAKGVAQAILSADPLLFNPEPF